MGLKPSNANTKGGLSASYKYYTSPSTLLYGNVFFFGEAQNHKIGIHVMLSWKIFFSYCSFF